MILEMYRGASLKLYMLKYLQDAFRGAPPQKGVDLPFCFYFKKNYYL